MRSTKRTVAAVGFLALLCSSGFAQTAPTAAAGPSPAFELADVHASAHTSVPFFVGGGLRGDRYLLHNASLVDMISLAYGIDHDNVLSGPSWLDFDRFDVSARAPRGSSPDDVKLMLQALLAQRFHLVLHKDTHPLPSYVLRVGKDGPRMKQADEGEASGVDEHHTPTNLPPGTPAYYSITCRNLSMTSFRRVLQDYAALYIAKPVVDATGLKSGYDFELHWTSRPSPGGLSIFEAVQKQIGLTLALEPYPTLVLIVDKADEQPTPNASGIDKALPPPPPAEFEVAILNPSKPDAPFQGRITGNQITGSGMTVRFFISYAYNLNPGADELIANAPKWLSQDHWDILAKAAPDAQSIGPDGKPQFDIELLPHMVQTMLAERFQMKNHFEDRPIEAFTLVAVNPKMKKADPLMRTGCKEGPGPDGKDPRIADPILGRLLYCQNMTMARFAELLPSLAGGYIFTPVLDSTGLKDGYDFTLSFSTSGQLASHPPPRPSTDPNSGAATSDPSGGLSLPDAIVRQLGVKLVKEKRPSPVLVIDHIDEQPTPN